MTASLQVLDAGVAATLQDGGREGYQRFGVPVSGALDKVSLAIANTLAGNAPHEAALEVLAAGLSLLVRAESVTLAVAGTAGSFVLETAQAVVRIPPFRSLAARRGDIVRFPPPKGGAVFYVAVAGGFDVPSAFGSRSTCRRAALGGFNGRALQAGDELPLRFPAAPACEAFALDVTLSAPDTLRVMRGPNAEYFKPRAFETLLNAAYTIAPASDRMGLRLQGAVLERAIQGELPSQGTTAGALQAPSDGQPILLLADRQTIGGYPRIATVISA
ncbi:MAG: biotin-dependent carboxyltransferase family protein, partial [Rhodomicrobium sp.]